MRVFLTSAVAAQVVFLAVVLVAGSPQIAAVSVACNLVVTSTAAAVNWPPRHRSIH